MLFKRKGGNNKKDQQAKRFSKDENRNGNGTSNPNPPSRDWDSKTQDEMSSIMGRKEDAQNAKDLEGTRRAVAQRRASKKLGSIDWDVAARDEITALFGFKDSPNDPAPSADTDLESVRRAIAERKAKSENKQPENTHASPSQRLEDQINADFDFNDEDDDAGPRLDWLVDFISDDDQANSNGNGVDPSNARGYTRSEELNNYDSRSSDINSNGSSNGAGPGEIELVLGAQDEIDENDGLNVDAIMGDGFGNLEFDGGADSANNGATSFFDEIVKEVGDTPESGPADSPPPSQVPSAPRKPAQPANPESKLPAKRGGQIDNTGRTLDLDALRTKDRVVGILLKKQIVTMGQVYEAQKLKERESSKETLWRILVSMDTVDSDAVFEEAARIYAFPIADTKDKLDAKFVRSVMETLSEENRDRLLNLHLVPFECETENKSGNVKLVFITHDPMRTEVRKVMKELKLDRFDLYYAPKSAVESVIVEAFPRKNEFMERVLEDPMAFDLGMSYEEGTEIIDEDALEAEISRSSLINLFEATLVEAVRQGASDVHIYPNAKKRVEIHFRIDGRLSLWHTEHKVHPEALLAVIKDNAMNVDRFERDAAQDGYIQRWIDDVLIRFRVSVLPIANASAEIRSESIVIRVLDDRKVIRDLKKLGLLDSAMQTFESAISQPHGMVILTGPTGSGKSTSLVAALHHVITGEVNVLTVEDPVEYIIPGVRQIKLNFKLELENALRAILRHDPDIVMVGEMRDRKTAELAIRLANTGHLTFSTLHTNDAPSASSRLYKMGIEPFLIAYAINLIVAQRLIRKLCSNCKQPDLDPDPVMLEKLGFTKEEVANLTFYEPGNDASCPNCKGVGYKGRRAICEALFFSREVRHMIVEADKMIDEGAIKKQAVKEGMLTLRDSAREIVKLGETSVREMIRVVTAEG